MTERTLPSTEHPVEDPALNVTAPVPEPPEEESVEVAPYATVEGVAIAVSAAWFAILTVNVCVFDVPPPGRGFTTVTADVVGAVRSDVRIAA